MSVEVYAAGSIRRRLIVQLVASAAILAAALFLIVQNLAQHLAEESQDNVLIASVSSILESASVQDGRVLVDIPYSALSMLGNISDDRVFYRVTASGAPLTGYADLPAADGPADADGRRFLTTAYGGESVRLVQAVRRLSVDGRSVEVMAAVAQTRSGQAAVLERVSRAALALGLGFFAATAGLAFWAARSAVRPLMRLADAVARRGPQDLRPVADPVPSEMVPLVSALNSFIARLKRTLARSEEFIAEAAHRVRTPLATLRTQAELMLRRVDTAENRTALREMIRAIDESSRAAGQLLDHAMITLRSDQMEPVEVDLSNLVSETVERMRPVAELRDIAINVHAAGPARMTGDAILIQNAVSNLLDNAIKYAPEDSAVRVDLRQTDAEHEIRIIDEGQGFPPGEAPDLTRRFARGSNVGASVGSGLGLTIAKEVAEVHRGRLEIDENPDGAGACVSLLLPQS